MIFIKLDARDSGVKYEKLEKNVGKKPFKKKGIDIFRILNGYFIQKTILYTWKKFKNIFIYSRQDPWKLF